MSASVAEPPAGHPMPGNPAPEHRMASMLGLCEAQMDSALQESDQAVDTLIKAFTNLVDTTRGVGTLTEHLPEHIRSTVTQELETQVTEISRQMASAVIAFQFYDKLTQRLGHVRYSLSALATFVCDREQIEQPEQWHRLHTTLRGLYRTQEEREIFQIMMKRTGADVINDADFAPSADAVNETQTGEIELF
jgi:hypothetical protein